MSPVGQPTESPKPQPMGGSMPMIFLFTMCTLCALFLLWRQASSLRSVISHQLKTLSNEGTIRLSEDEGPSAREFLEDSYDEDNEGVRLEGALQTLSERFAGEEVPERSPPKPVEASV